MTEKIILPDVLKDGLQVVFCGTAASTQSAQVGAYYAGPGNYFWAVIHRIGLTAKQLKPEQFKQLPQYGIGLTDLVKNQSGNDNVLQKTDFAPELLREKMGKYQPRILAFTSKRAGKEFFGQASIDYGLQKQRIHTTAIYVLPSTSGAARGYWDEGYWQILADDLNKSQR